MARRTKRRPTSTRHKRPPTPAASRATVQEGGPAEPEAAVLQVQAATSPPEPVSSPAKGSFLPRRQSSPARAEAALPSGPAPAVAATAAAAGPSATTSFLPRKGRVAGRAERQRQQAAHLEPLDDSPAVPTDRTPYLWLDLRKVLVVSAVMVLMVIVGFFVLH